MFAWAELAQARRLRERAARLFDAATGARGDERTINDLLSELRESDDG